MKIGTSSTFDDQFNRSWMRGCGWGHEGQYWRRYSKSH